MRAYAHASRGARVRPRAGLRPRARRRSGGPRAVERSVRRAHHVPRAVRAVRLPRRDHVARAGHRRHHPAAAPDGARRQAGRRGRPADRRPLPPRRRRRLERGRVRGARARRSTDAGPAAGASRSRCCGACGPSESVTHDGAFERVTAAGLAPLPVQRPIPIWIGGQSPPAYRRVGRLADGWFPQVAPGPTLDEALAIVDACRHRGRPRSDDDRHGGAGQLDRRRHREARRPGRSVARRRAPATCRSTR